MAHYLKMPKKSQVLALLELGWSYRQIEAETGVRRETVSRYDRIRSANAAKTFPGSDATPPAVGADSAVTAPWTRRRAHRTLENRSAVSHTANRASSTT